MNKPELNKVEHSKLVAVAKEAGLTVTEQTAYTKCTFEGSPAKIYIANTQKVTRVDFSGFTLKRDGITQISREDAKLLKLGNVEAQLDFAQTEEVVLEALAKAAQALKEVPAPAPKVKTVRKTVTKTATPTTAKTVETPTAPVETSPEDEAKIARRAAIKEAAERRAAEATA